MTPGSDPTAPDAFLAGRLLIATPGIGDPRFERALILMCTHGPDEAMGVAVNRPLEGLSLAELLERLGAAPKMRLEDQPVLVGGPVERERGFVVHTADYDSADSTLPVGDGLALTTTREVLEVLGDPVVRPRRALLALGYAAWSAGQLEQELKDNVWLTCEADEALVFDDDHGTKWARALGKIGGAAAQLSSLSGRA